MCVRRNLVGYEACLDKVEEVDIHSEAVDKFSALLVSILCEGNRDLAVHLSHHRTEGAMVAILCEDLAQL